MPQEIIRNVRIENLSSPILTAQILNTAGYGTNHSSLINLAADDHPQYFNEERGDDRYALKSLIGQPNGIATLDVNGLIPPSQLPGFVDDVLEFADVPSFPTTGETGKLYVDLSEDTIYRWSGSTYIQTAGVNEMSLADVSTFSTDTAKSTFTLSEDTKVLFNKHLGATPILSIDNNLARVGIGTSSPNSKLHVVGKVKIVDGTQGYNKILTSDENGLASWAPPQVTIDKLCQLLDVCVPCEATSSGSSGSGSLIAGLPNDGDVLTWDADSPGCWRAEPIPVPPPLIYTDIDAEGSVRLLVPNGSNIFGDNSISDTSRYSTILGGVENIINTSDFTSILNGVGNQILSQSHYSTILGGNTHEINNSTFSTILGGQSNKITNGNHSIIGGRFIDSIYENTFIWSDGVNLSSVNRFEEVSHNSFNIHAIGGLRLVDGNEAAGYVLTCDANGTGHWAAPSGGGTLEDISVNSTNAAQSTYTLKSNVNVEFKSAINEKILHIDEANASVSIGTSNVSSNHDTKLYIEGNGGGTGGRTFFKVKNTNTSSAAAFSLENAHGQFINIQNASSGYVTGAVGSIGTNQSLPLRFTTDGHTGTGGTAPILFSPGGYDSSQISAKFAADGNVMFGGDFDPETPVHIVGGGQKLNRLWAPFGGTTFLFEQGDTSRNASISMASGRNKLASINFGDEDDENPGTIFYDNATDSLNFGTNNIWPRVTIDSSGNMGIGSSTPSTSLHIEKDMGSLGGEGIYLRNTNTNGFSEVVFDNNVKHNGGGFVFGYGGTGTGSPNHAYFWNRKPGPIRFGTDAIERVRIDPDGNVGIGTDTPTSRLHVDSIDNESARIYCANATGSSATGIRIMNKTGGAGDFASLSFGLGTSTNTRARMGAKFGSGLEGSYTFQTRNTAGVLGERMVINSEGNVGIGTDIPDGKLEVLSDNANSEIMATSYGNTNSNIPVFTGRKARGTKSSPVAVQNGDYLFFLGGRGYQGNGSFPTNSSGAIVLKADETHSSSARGTSITFETTDNGTSTRDERLRIDHSGNVGIATSTPSAKLHVSNDDVTVNAGLISGTAPTSLVSGNGTTINSTIVAGSSSFNRPVFQGRRSRGTLTAPSAVINNDYIMSFVASGYDGSASQFGAAIDFFADANVTNGNVPTRISLSTGSNSSNRTERLTVKSDGDIGIGTTLPTARLHALAGSVAEMKFSSGALGITPALSVGNTNASGKFATLIAGTNGSGLWFDQSGHFSLASASKADYTANGLGVTQDIRMRVDGSTGNVGIATPTPSEKLHLVGKIRIEDGTEGANKVLTCDANGVGSWVTPSGGSGPISIDSLTDVDTSTVAPNNGESLVWNSTTSNWEPSLISGGTGSVGSLQTVTNNGSTTTNAITIEPTAVNNTRESLLKGSVSDAGDDAFYLGNGTSGNGKFSAQFAGYTDSYNTGYSQTFWGLTNSANDVSDSSTFGLTHFSSMITSNPSDPTNGTLTSPINRKLFTFGGNGASDIHMTIAASGNLGIGTGTPSAKLHIEADGISGREELLKGSVSDSGNDAFYLGNGTATNGSFVPRFAGYMGSSSTKPATQFWGLTSAANDASDSASAGLINFAAGRAASATDPTNGSLSPALNRKLFTFGDVAGGGNHMTIAAGGNVGFGTDEPDAKVDVNGRMRFQSTTEPAPTSGKGFEAFYSSGSDKSFFLSIDRDPSTDLLKGIDMRGSDFEFWTGPDLNNDAPRVKIVDDGLEVLDRIKLLNPVDGAPAFRSLYSGAANFRIQSSLRNGSQSTSFNIDAVGQPGDSNRETLVIGYFTNPDRYKITANESGTGVLHPLHFEMGWDNPVMTIETDGKVGIGTTTPDKALNITGSGPKSTLKITDDGTGSAAAEMYIGTNDGWSLYNDRSTKSFNIRETETGGTLVNTDRLTIQQGGNIGIGTTSPTADLEVNGVVKITGGSPGAGKVLTSDAGGTASWQTPTGGTGGTGGTETSATPTAETSFYIDAGAMQAPEGGASPSSSLDDGTNNSIDWWNVDTNEELFSKVAMPPQWDGGDIDVEFFWTVNGASAGDNVRWAASATGAGNGDAWDATFSTVTETADDLLIANDDVHIIKASGITPAGTTDDGNMLFIKLKRTPTVAQTASVDARLLGVRVHYKNVVHRSWYVNKMGAENEEADATVAEKTAFVAADGGIIYGVHSGVSTATSGAGLSVDVKINGVSILSTLGVIGAAQNSSDDTLSTSHILATNPTTFSKGDRISFELASFGGTGGNGLHTDLLISWAQ